MISKTVLSRNAQITIQSQCRSSGIPKQCRGLAAAASGSFSYEAGDASGIKYASRDIPGPTTTLAVVARAGTRFQPLPGFSEGLEKYAFKVREKLSISSAIIYLTFTLEHEKTFGIENQS